MAQYPIRKVRLFRTIKNVLPDGSMILFPDADGARLVWQLVYADLAAADAEAIQSHFNVCLGPFHAFTFIDPTDNMLVSSSDLTAIDWQTSTLIELLPGAADPTGGSAAFTATNTGQADQEISQSLVVPANYQYCFSIYASSIEPSALTLIRRGSSVEESNTVAIGPGWSRITSSGKLSDLGGSFAVAISLVPGQQVGLYGMQLEAQMAPSRYRPTAQQSAVYSSAHWVNDQLTIVAEGPNLFSTSFSIEAAI